ncbi:uncharacterized protein LOC115440410 [Manduca sexta]|uniref:uncharacterized protein LOC115440410 n=1 Tax=Manduca sexta TaxID=7130 RepID=UPI0018906F03|nr:uncharacterized protein LOC115440410 [Manduca sexta]
MAKFVLQNACYIIIFTLCVDRGDGHWKENTKENLRRDINSYKRMAEKIEREIEAFYDEYPGEQLEDNIDTIHYQHRANTLHSGAKTNKVKAKNVEELIVLSTNATNLDTPIDKNESTTAANEAKWPKFEEILLAMGKKYDWKNDRWIKVKVKDKMKNIDERDYKNRSKDNEINLVHEKHKFYYKFVKLNRSKNRRSVVVAVSAVR